MMPVEPTVNPTVPPRRPLPRPGLRWVAAMAAVMVGMLGLLAASPELHAMVHHDAGHEGHACAVTLFSQGLEHPAVGASPAPAPALFVVAELVATEPPHVESPRDWLLPGRGPPVG